MSGCIVRVELHYPTEQNYKEFHRQMESAGFSRQIQSGNGVWYHLPQAEYHTTKDDVKSVYDSANRAATASGASFWLLVTGASSIMWNLPKVSP